MLLENLIMASGDSLKQRAEPDVDELKESVVSRLRTFSTWSSATALSSKIKELAESGFWYPGFGAELKCAYCDILIGDWNLTDDVNEKHKLANPRCPLFRKPAMLNGRNNRFGANHERSNQPVFVRNNSDLQQLLHNSEPNWFEPRSNEQNIFNGETAARFNRFKRLEVRLATYQNTGWPGSTPVSPEELARGGWFYTGVADRVQCPWCNGSVYNWEVGDTALGEHRRHFPHCSFVQEKLKEAFEKPVAKQDRVSPPNTMPRITKQNWRESVAARAVLSMDLDEAVIEKAVHLLLSRGSDRFNAEVLMDAVFEIEADPNAEVSSSSAEEWEREHLHGGGATGGFERETESHISNMNSNADHGASNFAFTPKLSEQTLIESTATGEKPGQQNGDLEINKGLQDIELLKEENERLKNNITCKICMDSAVGVLFLPCRHLICCAECAESVRKCPLCRARIIGTIKAFL